MGVLKKLTAAVALALVLALLSPCGSAAQRVLAPSLPTRAPTPTRALTPLPTPRLFHCSCSTAGQPVLWAGSVAAPNFFLARQAATGRCLAALGAKPTSPFLPPPAPGFAPGAPVPPAPIVNPCSTCACN